MSHGIGNNNIDWGSQQQIYFNIDWGSQQQIYFNIDWGSQQQISFNIDSGRVFGSTTRVTRVSSDNANIAAEHQEPTEVLSQLDNTSNSPVYVEYKCC